jgi:hypothetical protein
MLSEEREQVKLSNPDENSFIYQSCMSMFDDYAEHLILESNTFELREYMNYDEDRLPVINWEEIIKLQD